MKLFLGILGWLASIAFALVGVGFAAMAGASPYLALAAVPWLCIALALNPLVRHWVKALQRPLVVLAVVVVSGIAIAICIAIGVPDLHAREQRAAAAAQARQEAEEQAKQEAALRALVMPVLPMDDAAFARFKIVVTAKIDPQQPEALRKYAQARIDLQGALPGVPRDQQIDDLVKLLSDPSMRPTIDKMNAASTFAKTITEIQFLKAEETTRSLAGDPPLFAAPKAPPAPPPVPVPSPSAMPPRQVAAPAPASPTPAAPRQQQAAQRPSLSTAPAAAQPMVTTATPRLDPARENRLEALLANAEARDTTGQSTRMAAAAKAARRACQSQACVNASYASEEAQLRQWDGAQ